MKELMVLAIVIFISASSAGAGCKSDCLADYQAEIDSCRTNYTDQEDAEELQLCMDDAKKEYDACIQECED